MEIQIKVWFYSKQVNFGDLLTVFILNHYAKITERATKGKGADSSPRLCFVKAESKESADLVGIGSVLDNMPNTFSGHVWTSGSLRPTGSFTPSEKVLIWGLRGKQTAEIYTKNPTIHGDGALLLGMMYKKPKHQRYRLGIVPHYVDEHTVRSMRRIRNLPGVIIISPKQTPHKFMQKLLQCKCIFSSSLHGLISADAVGIPNRQFRVCTSRNIVGGQWKYSDYYSALGIMQPRRVIPLSDRTPVEAWIRLTNRFYRRENLHAVQNGLDEMTKRLINQLREEILSLTEREKIKK